MSKALSAKPGTPGHTWAHPSWRAPATRGGSAEEFEVASQVHPSPGHAGKSTPQPCYHTCNASPGTA